MSRRLCGAAILLFLSALSLAQAQNREITGEVLNAVTREAMSLRDRFKFPGMRVMQFGFGAGGEYHLPHNYPRRCVAYTGTHDNDTAVGWFNDAGDANRSREQVEKERAAVLRYLGSADGHDIHWQMIRVVYASVANLVIVPVQDVLGLGSEARMNRPGTAVGNWRWRLDPRALTPALAQRLHELTETYGRLAP